MTTTMTVESILEQGELFGNIGWEIGAVEAWADELGYDAVIGVDEAGRGPLAGPVVTAACTLDIRRARAEGWLERVADSKTLTPEERDELFDYIRHSATSCAVDQAEADEIDAVNILQATLRSMARALRPVRKALAAQSYLVAVDGNQRVPGVHPQEIFVKGDARSYHIAAASILAKVCRDRILDRYDARWPEYGFGHNRGYPTPFHRRTVLSLGRTPIHRRSFQVSDPALDGLDQRKTAKSGKKKRKPKRRARRRPAR